MEETSKGSSKVALGNDKRTHDHEDGGGDRKSKVEPVPSRQRPSRKIFQDVISVRIPIDATVDLGIAIQRTRAKRIEALEKAFPELVKDRSNGQSHTQTTHQSEEENDDGKETKNPKTITLNGDTTSTNAPKRKQAKALKNLPRPQDYANILDYLEAKYVQGVMIDDDEVEANDGDEGGGSVYSESSFLDDTDLQRTVAEQVLAHTTTTKIGLQQQDNDFFVNIGNLEVEETELTDHRYDPLDDTKIKAPIKRKRKNHTANSMEKSEKTAPDLPMKQESDTSTKEHSVEAPPKKKMKIAKIENAEENAKTASEPDQAPSSSDSLATLEKKCRVRKEKYEKLYRMMVERVNNASNDELPRRLTKLKVSITCPSDKKPGDTILFANPHVSGQKLKVKVPKNAKPGTAFKVTVPVAQPDEGVDHNRLTRETYDALDDYARAYDDWCDSESDYRKAIGDKEFSAHFEKRKKFDEIVKDMPQDLKTPLDKVYLQKILRRARQNRHKREMNLAKQMGRKAKNEPSEADDSSSHADSSTRDGKQSLFKQVTFACPELVTQFPVRAFSLDDFK